MTFAELLREKRLGKGFSQEKLAQRCGVSVNSLQAWERGGVAPGIGCLKLLATALDVPLLDFFHCDFPADHRLKVTAK